MVYCSRITVHGLLLVTIQKLYCNTICLLHYYLAIQFSNFLPLQYTLVYCNTIFHVVCFPTILQYNVAIQFPPSLAIQSLATTQPRLQYSFVLQLNLDYSCNTIQATQAFFSTIQKLYCNTIFTTIFFFQPSLLQYKTKVAIQKFSSSQYNLGSSLKTVLHQFFFFFIFSFILLSFQLLENF